MELTPELVNEKEFHLKVRGYNPDEVDDFLEVVAVGIGQLQERLRQADERARALEQRAKPAHEPAGAPVDDDADTIRRTLVLAQRTADATVREAEETATRSVASAQEQAKRLLAEAESQSAKLLADAQADARRSVDDSRQRLIQEIITLEARRDSLKSDVGVLERQIDEQRLRLRSTVTELQRLLDDPSRLRMAAAPELSSAALPGFVVEDDERAGPAEDDERAAPAEDDERAAPAEPSGPAEEEPAPEADPGASGTGSTGPADENEFGALGNDIDEEAWSRFAPDAARTVDDLPLAGSRTARAEGVDQHGAEGLFDQDEHDGDARSRSRFGRRR